MAFRQARRALRGAAGMHTASLDALGPRAAWPAAFVFDIDGVLCRGSTVIPAAVRAMERLYNPAKDAPLLPVAFLTNGGGVTERRKAAQLSTMLGVQVRPEQVVLSHTPFRSLAPRLGDQPVLVVGRGDSLEVANSYGFRKTVTALHVAKALPAAVPFWREYSEWSADGGDGRPAEVRYRPTIRYGTPEAPIRAVLVFADPSNWYLALQIVTDVLVGGGVLGRRPEDVPADTPPVEVYFSNPDLVWANDHPVPRFGQGAFAACVEALHERLTGRALTAKFYGKPNAEPYRLIEEALRAQAEALGVAPSGEERAAAGAAAAAAVGRPLPPFSSVFAVGDNSAADVRGANAAGHPWRSVLVRTGVFQGPGPNCPQDPADIVVDDVEAAVEACLNASRSAKWHSMR